MSGLLVVVSGPSGAGKSTVLARLTAEMPRCKFSISMTTRAPRSGEQHGVHYYFVSEAEFLDMQDRHGFLESAQVHRGYYGTPREAVMRELEQGFDIILDIDVQGAMQVRASHADPVLIFLAPPSMEELRRRLEKRGSETPASLEMRMDAALKEMDRRGEYQYLVINSTAKDQDFEAVEKLKSILIAEKCKTTRVGFFFNPELATTLEML